MSDLLEQLCINLFFKVMLSEPQMSMRIRPKLCLKFVQIMSGQWRCQVYNMKVINKKQEEKKENMIENKNEEVVPRQDIITTKRS